MGPQGHSPGAHTLPKNAARASVVHKGHLMPHSAIVLSTHFIYHCALVQVGGVCHRPRHLHSPALWGRRQGQPLLDHETSQPCRVHLQLSASGPALLLWRRQRSARPVSLGVTTGHLCPSSQSLGPGADEGGSWGMCGQPSVLPLPLLLLSLFLGPAWPVLLGQEQPANYLSKGLRLGAVPM